MQARWPMAAMPVYLTLSGNGTQILSGTDTYSGPTTINSGTLQIGDGGATGSLGNGSGSGTGGGTVTNDGALVFDLSSTSTVPNAIQGTGSLSQIGTGTTTLTASNSYGGGTFVTSGTLATAPGGTLGTGPVNVSGGVLDVSSGPLSVGALTVGSGGTLNVAIGKLLTSSGAASFGGTLDISGTPSGNLDELIAFSGVPTGTFATVTSEPNYALLYTTGQLDLVSYNAINAASGTTATINGSVDLLGGQLPISGGGSTVINGSLILDGASADEQRQFRDNQRSADSEWRLGDGERGQHVDAQQQHQRSGSRHGPRVDHGRRRRHAAIGRHLVGTDQRGERKQQCFCHRPWRRRRAGHWGQPSGWRRERNRHYQPRRQHDLQRRHGRRSRREPTASQILQNTLTIGANSTVTIAPVRRRRRRADRRQRDRRSRFKRRVGRQQWQFQRRQFRRE